MSLKVVVACEDHTLDQYILKPIIVSMLAAIGKPKANVSVLTNPRIQGFDNLLDEACSILTKYGAIAAVVLFVVDRDCDNGPERRRNKVTRLRRRLGTCDRFREKCLVVGAINEVEVWALWGTRTTLGATWTDVREECHPKELFFEPLITTTDRLKPDRGRKRLVEASLQAGWNSLKQGCPELASLEQEIRPLLGLT